MECNTTKDMERGENSNNSELKAEKVERPSKDTDRYISFYRDPEMIVFIKKSQLPTCKRKDLVKICKERRIKYATCMRKQEMIEVLRWNDEDSSVNVHPDAQKRVAEQQNKYRDNPEQREKARECAKRWRINNPENVKEYFAKWEKSILDPVI